EIDAGELSVLGLDARRRRREVKARLGVVPQETNLDNDLTIRENLLVQARYFGLRGAAAVARVEELLDFALLSERAGGRVQELSGGMKRRLLIERGLINEPGLDVFGDATTGLD